MVRRRNPRRKVSHASFDQTACAAAPAQQARLAPQPRRHERRPNLPAPRARRCATARRSARRARAGARRAPRGAAGSRRHVPHLRGRRERRWSREAPASAWSTWHDPVGDGGVVEAGRARRTDAGAGIGQFHGIDAGARDFAGELASAHASARCRVGADVDERATTPATAATAPTASRVPARERRQQRAHAVAWARWPAGAHPALARHAWPLPSPRSSPSSPRAPGRQLAPTCFTCYPAVPPSPGLRGAETGAAPRRHVHRLLEQAKRRLADRLSWRHRRPAGARGIAFPGRARVAFARSCDHPPSPTRRHRRRP